MAVVQNKEKFCTLYIQPEDSSSPPPNEIQKTLETGKYEDRIKALKQLITNIIHDDSYPRMVMTIFNYLLPLQSQSHEMKKVLFFYWEIVEKLNANGTLKDEFILVCNSLRNDLLHPNEYIRGRTLKLLSRVMIRGLLEALIPSIMSNLTHKHSYVRRNAVSCVYAIYLAFKDDMLTDIDEHIEKLLKNETDISTKRNAFLLLFNANQQKALAYINENIINDSSDETGDIIQLVILELLRKTCKVDPPQKNRLLKAIYFFSKSKSSSVLFECANTLVQISRTPTSLKLAINIYIQLLISNTDNNVKLIVLEKLMHIRVLNPKLLEDQVLEIANILQIKDLDIKKKTLDLMRNLISSRNISTIFPLLIKESCKMAHSVDPSDVEYRVMLLNYFSELIVQFPQTIDDLLAHIMENYLSYSKLDESSANEISNLLKLIMNGDSQNERSDVRKHNLCANLGSRLSEFHHITIIKTVLWIVGEFSQDENVEANLNNLKRAIGPLPLEPEKKNHAQQHEEDEAKEKQKAAEKKIKVKTVILPDGTYGTEIVNETETTKEVVDENHTALRAILISNTYVSSILTTCQMKLLYRLKDNLSLFNKYGSEILLIFCSLIRLYQTSENKVDRELIEKIKLSINLILHPENFRKSRVDWLEPQSTQRTFNQLKIGKSNKDEADGKGRLGKNHVVKQADDLIVIRQLKGRIGTSELDLSDEEMNEVFFSNPKEEEDYTSKLAKTVQLTGYSDPIYAEAFVSIHKYDITFEILLVNRVNKALQNVSIEFSTQGDLRVVERPQQMVLPPLSSTNIKTSIKLSSAEAGLIFASINFENSAGITQSYMITNEILIDIIDFIYPADISVEEFRRLWSKYEWENRIIINTNIEDSIEYIRHIERSLKMKCLKDIDSISEGQKFVTTNLYAKTKLDDDFLMNISIEKIDNKITGYLRIRSKTKGIVINLGERIKKIQQI